MSNSTAIIKIENSQIAILDAEIVVSETTPVTDYLGEFLAGKSSGTAKVYRHSISEFLVWGNITEGDFMAMSGTHAYRLVSAYQAKLQDSNLASNTILKKLAAIRSFKNWGGKSGVSTSGALPSLDNLPAPQVYKDTRGTSGDKMVEILSHLSDSQDKVIWGMLFLLGLRCSEVANIDLGDINLSEKTVAIKGKGKRDKVALEMPEPLVEWVSGLLAIRSGGSDTPLIQNKKNNRSNSKRLSTRSIYSLVKKWGEMVGVEGLRPHKIRHTAITVALDINNGNLIETAKFSRHASYDTLRHYDDNRQRHQLKVSNSLAQLIK